VITAWAKREGERMRRESNNVTTKWRERKECVDVEKTQQKNPALIISVCGQGEGQRTTAKMDKHREQWLNPSMQTK
jgi:hypothetical protein